MKINFTKRGVVYVIIGLVALFFIVRICNSEIVAVFAKGFKNGLNVADVGKN